MGSFFGGLLSEAGLDVVLIDVWAEHVENINTRGLRIVGVGGDRHVKVNNSNQVSCFINNIHLQVRATSDPSQETPVDIVFVQCKAAHTRQAVLGAKKMFHQVRREERGCYYYHDLGRGRSSYLSKMVSVTRSS